MEGMEGGMKMGGHLIQAVRLADDHAMTANTAEGLQAIVTKLNEFVENYGMRIRKTQDKSDENWGSKWAMHSQLIT